MKKPLAFVLSCALASPALALPAVPSLPVPRDVCGIQIPPARFARGREIRIGVDGPHYVVATQVAHECRSAGTDRAVGCTTSILLGRTVIAYRVLIADTPPPGTDKRCTPAQWRASVLRHERAHMAGWPADHPR
jgi:hypothetical protein